jgi:hypothetical protein
MNPPNPAAHQLYFRRWFLQKHFPARRPELKIELKQSSRYFTPDPVI